MRPKETKKLPDNWKQVFKPPFYYTPDGTMVFDQEGMVLDIRGWGRLTGTGALNLPEELAMKIQDQFGHDVAKLLNEAHDQSKE